jgi:hypothetical protein
MHEESVEDPRPVIPSARFTQKGELVFDPMGSLIATALSAENARRLVAALNGVEGVPTDALEGWTVGVVCDPINDLALELELVLEPPPYPGDRRRREDRRRGERRLGSAEIRIKRE